MPVHSRDVFPALGDPGDFVGRKDGEFDDRRQREMTLEPFTNLGKTPLNLRLSVTSQQSQENGRRLDDFRFRDETFPHDLTEK